MPRPEAPTWPPGYLHGSPPRAAAATFTDLLPDLGLHLLHLQQRLLPVALSRAAAALECRRQNRAVGSREVGQACDPFSVRVVLSPAVCRAWVEGDSLPASLSSSWQLTLSSNAKNSKPPHQQMGGRS